jgi:hypothetical protein
VKISVMPPLTFAGWLRYDVVARLLARLPEVRSILEIGAGRGALGARLAGTYDYLGLEPDEASRAVAARHARVVGGTTADLDPEARFDLVCAFEVLEHLDDDEAALRDWAARADLLLISVPAWRRLWGAADRAAGHVRRYDPDDLRSLLGRAGLDPVELILYGFPIGYPLKAARDAVARRRPPEGTGGSGRWLQPPDALGAATRFASAPFRRLQRAFPSRGTGIVCLARLRR